MDVSKQCSFLPFEPAVESKLVQIVKVAPIELVSCQALPEGKQTSFLFAGVLGSLTSSQDISCLSLLSNKTINADINARCAYEQQEKAHLTSCDVIIKSESGDVW